MNAVTNPTTITAQPGTPFLDLEREFDATPEQVYRAMTDPALVVQWYGPRKYEMRLDVWDVRRGGTYRFVHIDGADGASHGFRGVYHQVVPNELIIQTFEWEGAPNEACLEMMTLTDLGDGRTRLHTHSVFPSVEALEGALATGMEWGARESMDRLAELFAASS